ncbi:HNH endonuclease signature motif containing protein [Nocardia sp. NBC_01327]|uniref:HNH endonuclease signature motif containing protein n=1 Tax=Nocardia sp. NBC_01327 TaxID=2903593 RepID=UPI002E0D4A03|nr:HNH endonuclease [Nocardia sp. NBC_01327]
MESREETAITTGAAALVAAVDTLTTLSLIPLPDTDIVELMQQIETSTRRLASVQRDLIVQACARSLPTKNGSGSPALYLQAVLHISHGDAINRWRTAEDLAVWHRVGDEPDPAPILPCSAQALDDGAISLDHVRVIRQVMNRLPSKVPAEARAYAEQELARQARALDPTHLPRIGERILGYLDPDGTLTDDDDRQRLRSASASPQRYDLMSTLTVELTPDARGAFDAVMAKLARPGMCNPADKESPWAEDEDNPIPRDVLEACAARDERTKVQRQHDALLAVLHPDFNPAKLGSHRGLPVSTILTMSIEDVERVAGVATTATGGTVPVPEALKLAARRSKTFVLVKNKDGMPLHLGEARLANPAQRLALIATERGCTRPGCSAPASMAAVHHVTEFCKGGRTDIENLTLACDHCHALVKGGPRGWKTIKLGADSDFPGRTAWIAPAHVDPTGTPQVNHLHHPGELMSEAPPSLRPGRVCRAWGLSPVRYRLLRRVATPPPRQ